VLEEPILAGIQERSDDKGCVHRGIEDLFQVGGIWPSVMGYYSEPGKILFENYCRGEFQKPVAKLDKTE
jgi:hypothetical protein